MSACIKTLLPSQTTEYFEHSRSLPLPGIASSNITNWSMVCRPGGQSRKPRDYISATGTKHSELDVGQTYVLSTSPSPGDLLFLARLHLLNVPKLWGQSVQIPKSVGQFLIQITTGAVVERCATPLFHCLCLGTHAHTHFHCVYAQK